VYRREYEPLLTLSHLLRSAQNEVWAVGGSNTIYKSLDGGKSFSFDNSANNLPGNLYNVKFFEDGKGFALGSNGVLLKFNDGQGQGQGKKGRKS